MVAHASMLAPTVLAAENRQGGDCVFARATRRPVSDGWNCRESGVRDTVYPPGRVITGLTVTFVLS